MRVETTTSTNCATDKFEALRLLLEREQLQGISYTDACDIGEALLVFYEVLIEATDEPRE